MQFYVRNHILNSPRTFFIEGGYKNSLKHSAIKKGNLIHPYCYGFPKRLVQPINSDINHRKILYNLTEKYEDCLLDVSSLTGFNQLQKRGGSQFDAFVFSYAKNGVF